jgi:hypothetical protein
MNLSPLFLWGSLLLTAILPRIIYSQTIDGSTEVAYLFDDHTFRESRGQTKARPVGVALVEDRFGNDRSAVGLNGSHDSYLSLGVSPLLRPKTGTVSIWVNIATRIYGGKGSNNNPILLAKNGPEDDWYEAFALYFVGRDRSFVAACGKDPLSETLIHSVNRVKYGTWYHLAIQFSDKELRFYINGNLQGACRKPFEMTYLESDSLMVGHTANKKNLRFMMGAVDDIRIFHRLLSQEEIKALYAAPNPNRAALIFDQVLFWGGIIAGIILVSFLLVWQRRSRLKRAGERLDLNRKLHEMEIRTLKAQMNPHFIFNALNSIQVFIMNSDNAKAELYLSKFSKLLRELLESNTQESLSVAEEEAILNGYLEIESLRFGDSFSYTVVVDERINSSSRIPHMLIQPFVENAIWHGLLAKQSSRRLDVLLEYDSPSTIRCIVDDNGVGRKHSRQKEQTFKKQSLALSIVRQRLELMNELLKVNCRVEITDKVSGTGAAAGTRISVTLPILQSKN